MIERKSSELFNLQGMDGCDIPRGVEDRLLRDQVGHGSHGGGRGVVYRRKSTCDWKVTCLVMSVWSLRGGRIRLIVVREGFWLGGENDGELVGEVQGCFSKFPLRVIREILDRAEVIVTDKKVIRT
jgi:hypothetical protein